MNNQIKLTTIGFIKVGEWILDSNFNHTITTNLDKRSLLYSFVSDSEVLYIGKTADTLKNRMNGYKNAGGTQRTNIRVKKEIVGLLSKKKEVHIYILIDDAKLTFKNYNISLAAGLEDNLIADIKPKLNFRGNNRIKEQEMPPEDNNIIVESFHPVVNILKSVEIKLGQEYWNKGFFNFSKKDINYLPTEPTNVRLFLGDNSEFLIEGRFLFSTKDGQPRVTGNKSLKDWFQSNNKIGDKIKVDFIEPTLFKIH
jgi:hypothetical protein